MRRLLYVDFIIFFLFLLFIPIKAQSARLISYGFEDWTGDADTTPGYCFGTNYSDYWALHEESTEVISSYGSWTPSSGSYFFYREHHSGTSGGVLGGSNSGAINDHGNLGKCDYSHPDSSCSSGYGHTFNMETEFPRNRPGNDIFIRFII